jgi:hypothetical protein
LGVTTSSEGCGGGASGLFGAGTGRLTGLAARRICRTGLGGPSGLTTTGGSWSGLDCARAPLLQHAKATIAAEPAAQFRKPIATPSADPPSNELIPVSGRSPGSRSSRDPPSQTCGQVQWLSWIANDRLQLRGQLRHWGISPHRIPVSPSWKAPMTIAKKHNAVSNSNPPSQVIDGYLASNSASNPQNRSLPVEFRRRSFATARDHGLRFMSASDVLFRS